MFIKPNFFHWEVLTSYLHWIVRGAKSLYIGISSYFITKFFHILSLLILYYNSLVTRQGMLSYFHCKDLNTCLPCLPKVTQTSSCAGIRVFKTVFSTRGMDEDLYIFSSQFSLSSFHMVWVLPSPSLIILKFTHFFLALTNLITSTDSNHILSSIVYSAL